jgi:zinc transport system ATP-binding protein
MTEAPSRREVISVRHLWAGYDSEQVLADVSLSVRERDFIGLIGPNGGGKSTLIKVLLGLLTPTRGSVEIMGLPAKKGRRFIGYVPQLTDFDRAFPISVWDVARMGRLGRRGLLRPYTAEDHEAVAKALQAVDMFDLRHRPIGELSGGQRQRVYIARALTSEPKILLLDEPTTSVDPRVSQTIYEVLERLNHRVTILMISHDMSAISSYVKTVGCLNRYLFYHEERQLTPEMLELAYQCPIDLIAHGVSHRVFKDHDELDPEPERAGEAEYD